MGADIVVIVGAGPRGSSVMERLLARRAQGEWERPLHIHLVDPYPAGSGHVWRTEQSRLYLMNTPSFFPTLIPDFAMSAAPVAGSSFNDWRVAQRAAPWEELSAEDRAELQTLAEHDFPSRPLYGRYLRWCFAQLSGRLPDGVSLHQHLDEALRVVRRPAKEGFDVVLRSGEKIAADSVVLALGHVDSELTPAQRELREQARQNGLLYLPPAVPNDVDWDVLPAGQPVLVRGMGLNFFDVVGQLTEGRGGVFEDTGRPPGEALRYVASGREPVIVGASRRGTPYRAKADLRSYYPASVELRFLNEEAVAAITGLGTRAGFEHDMWPLLHRDVLWAYYTTLSRTQPDSLPAALLPALDALLHEGLAAPDLEWDRRLAAFLAAHVPASLILDLPALARPLTQHSLGRRFESRAALDAAVLEYLAADAAGSARGEDDPIKMAIGALNAGRAVIKDLVSDGGITAESWLRELRGWFEGFVEGLASGPPPLRVEQLAALVRAGVVHFSGPDPVFHIEQGVFTLNSPWINEAPWESRFMVEALAPANDVVRSSSPLVRDLLASGLVRPRTMLPANGAPVVTSGMDVSAPPYRPLDGAGVPVEGLYVLGLQLSSVQWGTAIAAQAAAIYPSGVRTLQDADAIAAAILS